MSARHFIDLWHLESAELREILDMAHAMKKARADWPKGRVDTGAPLEGHTLAMRRAPGSHRRTPAARRSPRHQMTCSWDGVKRWKTLRASCRASSMR